MIIIKYKKIYWVIVIIFINYENYLKKINEINYSAYLYKNLYINWYYILLILFLK